MVSASIIQKVINKNCFQWASIALSFVVFLPLLFPMPSCLAAESIEEGARREGRVLFYSTIPVSPTQSLMSAFQKKYPFIKAEYYRATTTQVIPKLLIEKQMGKTFADVVSAGVSRINILKKNDLLAKYVAPESAFVHQGFKDPYGFWTANYTAYYTFTYNTKMVEKKDLPKSYEDLLNPKWQGKIGLNIYDIEWFIGMIDYLGEEKGKQFMKRLAGQNPIIRRGREVTSNLMLAGEFPLSFGTLQNTRQKQAVGAPIDTIFFPTSTLAAMRMIGVHASAPHPNAAKLLLNFLLSREGQMIYQQNGYDPVRVDIKGDPLVEKIMLNMFPIKPMDPEVVESYTKEMDQIFQKR